MVKRMKNKQEERSCEMKSEDWDCNFVKVRVRGEKWARKFLKWSCISSHQILPRVPRVNIFHRCQIAIILKFKSN